MDSTIALINDINITRSVNSDALRVTELAIVGTKITPFGDVVSGAVELLDTVAISVYYIDVAG